MICGRIIFYQHKIWWKEGVDLDRVRNEATHQRRWITRSKTHVWSDFIDICLSDPLLTILFFSPWVKLVSENSKKVGVREAKLMIHWLSECDASHIKTIISINKIKMLLFIMVGLHQAVSEKAVWCCLSKGTSVTLFASQCKRGRRNVKHWRS